MRKKISFHYRFLLYISTFATICFQMLCAQNIRIGMVDQGSTYSIGAGVTNQTMAFTEAGAIATAGNDSTWNGRVVMDDSGTISVSSNATLILGGGISGNGDLTTSGSGIFLLNSTSTQTGGTIISAGTFQAGKNKVFSAESAFSLTGTLDLNDTSQEIASLSGSGTLKFGSNGAGTLTVGGNNTDTNFSGTFSDQGTVTKIGTGTLFLTGSGSSAVDFDVQDGTLDINGNFSSAGSSITVRDTAILGGTGSLYDVIIESGGTLAPGNRTGYEVLATDTLTIENSLTLASGSILSIRVDDVGNSDQIIVGGTYTNTDSEANLEIDALAGKYEETEITYDRFLVDNAGANLADFTTENISLRQKFLELNNVTDAPNSFQIARIENYFMDRALTHNQRQVATVLDQTGSPRLWQAMTNIAGSTDQSLIDDAYHEMSGSIKANSHMLGQWKTSRHGLNHLDLSQCECASENSLWLEFVHQSINTDGNDLSRDYGVSRTGVLLGAEESYGNIVFGMLGGYAKPYLYSQGDKYDVGDLQFGFYGGATLMDRLETKLYIGFGSQSYHSKRHIRNSLLGENDSVERIKGDFSGNSMSMSLEFAVPFELGIFGVRPLLAFDSDMSWQYGYSETGDTGLELAFNRSFFDRTYIRTGLTTRLGHADYSAFSLVGRFYYGHQIGGDSSPVSRCRFISDPMVEMKILGANLGKDYYNLGIGFRWNIDDCCGFYGDYDYSALNKSTGHTGTIGFVQKW